MYRGIHQLMTKVLLRREEIGERANFEPGFANYDRYAVVERDYEIWYYKVVRSDSLRCLPVLKLRNAHWLSAIWRKAICHRMTPSEGDVLMRARCQIIVKIYLCNVCDKQWTEASFTKKIIAGCDCFLTEKLGTHCSRTPEKNCFVWKKIIAAGCYFLVKLASDQNSQQITASNSIACAALIPPYYP